MATATATATARLRADLFPASWGPVGLTIAGGISCVVTSIALAAGHLAGSGVAALGAAGFLFLAAWCLGHRRVDQTLAALGLYLGLLDGYIKLKTGNPAITLGRDVLVVAIATGALIRGAATQRSMPLPPLGGFVVAYTCVVLVELLNPEARGLAGSLAGVRQHLEFMPLFFLGYAFIRRESQLRALLLILVVCASAGGVVSYVQSTLTPQELASWGAGYRERVIGTGNFANAPRVAYELGGNIVVRPFGLGSDQGGGALAAALALPAFLALLLGAGGRFRLMMLAPAVGLALAVATSGSRAALITVFVSVLAFGLVAAASKQGLRVVIGLAIAAVLVYGAFAQLGSDNNTRERARSIAPSKALSTFSAERGSSVAKFGEYARRHPLGIGVGSVGPATTVGRRPDPTQDSNSETQWNFMILEVGLAGLAIYLAFTFRLLSVAVTRIRRTGGLALRLYLAALAAPLAAMLVAGFAAPTTTSVPTAPYLWLASGVLSYWLLTQRSAGSPASSFASR